MKTNVTRVYVHPKFEQMLKHMAVEKNKSVVRLTEELAEDDDITKLKFVGWKKNEHKAFRL
jgi:hypothetical protein